MSKEAKFPRADRGHEGEIVRAGFRDEHADCSRCELRSACKIRIVEGERPGDWQPGGLMFIGEGPGKMEVSLLRPFVGSSGRLLDALCEEAGIDRRKCWVTNATMGLPPPARDGGFHERFPQAIYSCLPRLEAEISAAQPRVIVTLGQSALIALSGFEVPQTRLAPNPCNNVECDPVSRKLSRKALECAMADCDWWAFCDEDPDPVKLQHGGKCPTCSSSITRLRPKKIKCPSCKGKKQITEHFTSFKHDFTLVGRNGVAGAVLPAESLASQLQQFGVKYIVPTYHPSFCLHPAVKGGKYIAGQYAARVAVEHIQKAARLLRADPIFRASARITTDPDEVRAYTESDLHVYGVDVETDSMDGAWGAELITCIGIAHVDREDALVVDTRNATPELLDALQDFLENRRKKKVFHNGQFDRVVIRRLWGMFCRGVVSDTLLSHHALYPDEEQGLGFVAHELLDAPHWKEKKRKLKPGEHDSLGGYRDFESLALYNARDTRSTVLADRVMRGPPGGVGRLDLERVRASHDVDVQMQEISVRMELFGLPLHAERVKEVEAHSEAERTRLLTELRAMVGRETWTNDDGEAWTPTGKELLWALFSADGPLRLEPFAYTDGGKSGNKQPSTAKEALARMRDQHPFVANLIEYRKYDYVLTHYIHGTTLRAQCDGRLHPQWKVYGTATTRWTSNPNFQNWSKGQTEKDELLNLRSLIEAPPGRRLVGADYAALELRVMADLSGDEALIARLLQADEARKYEPDYDPHAYMAFKVFGELYLNGDKKRQKALRDVVKRVVYGLNYGAGPATVLEAIYNGGYDGPVITLQMIMQITTVYFKEYPGVPRWRNNVERTSREMREVRSALLGSRRIFPLGDMDTTVLYNHPIQSSAANIMNVRLAVLAERLYDVDPSAEFFAQVHDAVYIECDERRADAVCACVTEALTCELSLSGGPTMLYNATAEHAARWDEC